MRHGHNVILELDLGDAAKVKGKKKARCSTRWSKRSRAIPSSATGCTSTCTRSTWPWRSKARGHRAAWARRPAQKTAAWSTGNAREVTVRALPSDMPDVIELDVTGLADRSSPLGRGARGTRRHEDPGRSADGHRLPGAAAGRGEVAAAAPEVAEPEVVGGAKSEE